MIKIVLVAVFTFLFAAALADEHGDECGIIII